MQEFELARRLGGVEFFSGLSEAKLRQIASRGVQLTHRPGTAVTEQGTEATGFHLIIGGTAVVQVGGETVATLHEGDSFGEISLIDGRPRSASVIAAGDGLSTLAISPRAFGPLLDDVTIMAVRRS